MAELLILFVSSPTLEFALNKSNMKVYCVLISSVASSYFPISSQLGQTPLRCQVPDQSDFLASIIASSLGLAILLATLGLTRGRLKAI